MIKFIELFAGIGGFRLGRETLGWKCVWANEIDPYACKVYRKNFGDKELYEGDIDWILESPNLIYSQQDSPANHSRLPANNSEKMTVEINGLPQSTPFAYYDQDTHSWKTFQESLALEDQRISGEYLETWPRAGMMHNGIVYRLQPSAPLTAGTGSGLLRIPTPNVVDATGRKYQYPSGNHNKKALCLPGYVEKFPTPSATERSGINPKTGKGGGLMMHVKKYPKNHISLEEGNRRMEMVAGSLNPMWVAWLMGYPTEWINLDA